MIRMLAIAAAAALLSGCAGPLERVADVPMHDSRGSTEAGRSKAASLGFHGPLHRATGTDGPN